MRICDPTANRFIPAQGLFGLDIATSIALVTGVVGTVAGVATSVIGGIQGQQAAEAAAQAQEAQARQAQQIANYNAEIQRQNAQVAFQMATYQAETNAQIAAFNQAAALNNAAFAQAQAFGAQRQYEQGQENARQLALQADAARRQGEEESRRKREENAAKISQVRAKYAASGVAFEGSPLVVLADAARLAESQVQDIAYATELESRKQLRAGEIEKFTAGFSLLDKAGFEVQAANAQLQANRFAYERDLYKYDSALAGVRLNIANKEAQLTELSGQFQAFGYQAEAQQSRYKGSASMLSGIGGGIASGFTGVSNTFSNVSYARGRLPTYSGYSSGYKGGSTGSAYS